MFLRFHLDIWFPSFPKEEAIVISLAFLGAPLFFSEIVRNKQAMPGATVPHAAPEQELHVTGVTWRWHIYVASWHLPNITPTRLSLGGAGLSSCRSDIFLLLAVCQIYRKPQQPNAKQPAIPPCLHAADGLFGRSTHLTHHIEGGAQFGSC